MNYYNDNNPFCVQWLENLVQQKMIPIGIVDPRNIKDVHPSDLKDFTQCHFFAGIGGWPLALQMAGWPENEPVWTGSCPCQPFSKIGKRLEQKDERHLWPAFRDLIEECKPPTVFGEQVAGKRGKRWLSNLYLDLEERGYSIGAANLPAAGLASPHKRQRIFWLANSECGATKRHRYSMERKTEAMSGQLGEWKWFRAHFRHGRSACANWKKAEPVECEDGKIRFLPIEPRIFPMAYGVSCQMAKVRSFGNAIVPQVGAIFIRSYMEAMDVHPSQTA